MPISRLLFCLRAGLAPFALLLVDPAAAAWPTDPTVNLPVCTAPGHQQVTAIVEDGVGGAIIAWADRRDPAGWNIYAQRVLASGSVDPAWPVDGRALCAGTIGYATRPTPKIVTDGSGGAIVVWVDYRNDIDWDVYAQHVLASGAVDPAWPVAGLAVCTTPNDLVEIDFSIMADGTGGAFVAWLDARTGSESNIYAHHVLLSGETDPAWPADGLAVCTAPNNQSMPGVVSDGVDGMFVCWVDGRTGLGSRIYVQHVQPIGSPDPTWPVDGIIMCTARSSQHWPAMVADGTGGAIIAWSDWNGWTYAADIYAGHVNSQGVLDPAWPAGGRAIIVEEVEQTPLGIVTDGAGGAIVLWESYAGTYTIPGLYAQRLLASGELDPVWPATGSALRTQSYPQHKARMISDGVGGAIATWEDHRSGAGYDIYAQRVLSNGATDPAWPVDGQGLCIAVDGQYRPQIATDAAGGVIVTWDDVRGGAINSHDIYAQRVQSNGQLGGDAPTATAVSLVTAEAHEGAVRLCWYVSPDAPMTFTLYRSSVPGEWLSLGTLIPDGSGYLRFEDADIHGERRLGYCIGLRGTDGIERFAGEAWVDVPVQEANRLVVPSPIMHGQVSASFAVPAGRSVPVMLLDLAGRVVASRHVTGGTGWQRVDLAHADDLAPGVYLVRVDFDRPVRARVVVIR